MENLRRSFVDICNGYSKITWNEREIIVKHLSHFDQINIDEEASKYYEDAKKRGIFTIEERLQFLEKEGLWTKKNEAELSDQKFYIDNLKKTRQQLALKLQIQQMDKTILEANIKYRELYVKKSELIGIVCENYRDRKMDLYHIKLLFYKNIDFKDKFFSNNELDELEDEEIGEILNLYSSFLDQFSYTNLKKIAVTDFFTSSFYLSDNLYDFFRKPLFFLTYYQSNLLSYGSYYKRLIQGNQIPPEILDQPDEIENFVRKSQNMKDMIEKGGKGDGRTGIVGITSQELKAMGAETPDVFKTSEKHGGINSIFEMTNSK
jgi:hypothetical protein